MYLGSREMLVSGLVADEDISVEEIRRIRRLLDERLEEMER